MVELRGVGKRFGDYVAVEEADLTILDGEFFSLLGPSGCGKTTTLRMIAGFETPTSGTILLDGVDVSKTPAYRRDVNTVFQHYGLFPHLSVIDNIAFGLRSKKVPKQEARRQAQEMLDVVRLPEFGDRRPHQLSGGQQQRIALARALVNRPRALLLDEPLGALDLKLRQSMQLELKRIQRELGIAFVFVTHDQEEALTMSDRILVMTHGKAAQIGTPEQIYNEPASVFVAGFIGTANILPVTVKEIDGTTATLTSPMGGPFVVDRGDRQFSVGQKAALIIRPERLDITEGAPNTVTAGCIQATLMSIVFQGPVLRCEVRTADGTDLLAHVHVDDMPSGVQPGHLVMVSWHPGGAYLVNDTVDPGQAGVTVATEDETVAELEE